MLTEFKRSDFTGEIFADLTPYEQWQLDTYGNFLPDGDTQECENGDMYDNNN